MDGEAEAQRVSALCEGRAGINRAGIQIQAHLYLSVFLAAMPCCLILAKPCKEKERLFGTLAFMPLHKEWGRDCNSNCLRNVLGTP